MTATPIGNLKDISLRAIEVMHAADVIACEDTRRTGRLLKHHGIKARLLAYHDHNEARVAPALIDRLARGEIIVLVSNAGTPLISDPGYRLVAAARERGLPVTALPGASAVITALAVTGLPVNQFFFAGFLPTRRSQRGQAVARLAAIPATLVLFESPRRLGALLVDLAAGLGRRDAAVARELTKLHEEVRRGTLAELAEHYAGHGPPKGEIVVVIAPPPTTAEVDPSVLDDGLRAALRTMSPSRAAAWVASETGVSRRAVYQRALALAKEMAPR